MIIIDKNDLVEIEMNLEGLLNLLIIMESSDYYKDTGEEGVCRALRNSLEYTKEKFSYIIENSKEISFE